MAKKYNNNWNAKKLIVSFNQKQWRQDLAAYIREKLFWPEARVTRSRNISNKKADKGIKQFEIFNNTGYSISIKYKNDNEIIECSKYEVVRDYLEEKGMI